MKLLIGGNTAPNLKYLSIHTNDRSDELVDIILESNILERLIVLDLSRGNMTDTSANKLFAHPRLTNLKILNLSSNSFSQVGTSLLDRLPFCVQLTDQDERRYRYFSAWE